MHWERMQKEFYGRRCPELIGPAQNETGSSNAGASFLLTVGSLIPFLNVSNDWAAFIADGCQTFEAGDPSAGVWAA
jgi:hypothetical protein